MNSGDSFRLLITASRKFSDSSMMRLSIMRLVPEDRPVVIVHGGAEGGDTIAKLFALEQKAAGLPWNEEEHPADWEGPCRAECKKGHRRNVRGRSVCPAAGVYRNQEMADAGADHALAGLMAQAKNKGTRDCIRRIRTARIPLALIIQR